MPFLLLIHAEIEVTDNKLDELQKKQNEVKKEITGEKEETTAATTIKKTINPTKSESCPSQYNSATIHISQGGCPPSNSTTVVNSQQVHDDLQQQKRRPLITCRPSHDIFETRDNLRDPVLPPHQP